MAGTPTMNTLQDHTGGGLSASEKSGLDASDLKNYRPVSNLSFLSNLLEKVVQVRLQAFLDENDLMPCAQSVYRKYHSTETAVASVYNDLLLAADQGLSLIHI